MRAKIVGVPARVPARVRGVEVGSAAAKIGTEVKTAVRCTRAEMDGTSASQEVLHTHPRILLTPQHPLLLRLQFHVARLEDTSV